MKILFFKPDFAWPRSSGHDVHTYQMMRAMSELGADIALATSVRPAPEAVAGIPFARQVNLDSAASPRAAVLLKPFEERFRSYWGIPTSRIAAFADVAQDFAADAVVVSGLDVLPMLGGITRGVRVWYAGDEWAWHHLSQVQGIDARSRANVKDAIIKGLYERAFRSRVDRAWTVSDADNRSLRWIGGVRHVDTLPNGIDAEFYGPSPSCQEPDSAVFWGRLDFGPNIQALEWFVDQVWPAIRALRPTAQFTIVGFRPEQAVMRLAGAGGVVLQPNLPDIRPVVGRTAVVVLPFVSGGGIKNKLLEAAAMGKAILATPRTLLGLQGEPPIRTARTPEEWQREITTLWDDEQGRRALGEHARQWVASAHTWRATAERALAGLERSLSERRREA